MCHPRYFVILREAKDLWSARGQMGPAILMMNMLNREAKPSAPRTWKILLAFAIIYFVWGSTYLAIRVGVREMPPFLMAAIRVLRSVPLYR